jgi:NAD(P)H-dependent flavin oxidoreductase YrpB (nitropropane dioxygenase family)
MSRPCIYGVFGSRVGGFHLIKEKCTGCMRCVQEYPGICTVDRNPEFFRFADSYWIPEEPATATSTLMPVSIVSYEAETGRIPIKGMGYKGSFAGKGWDSIWTDMSEIVRPTRDGVYGREYISTLVDFGRKTKFIALSDNSKRESSRTIEIPLPLVFDFLPSNLCSQSILKSVARAAETIGTFFMVSLEQVQAIPEAHRRNMVPLISPGDVQDHREVILNVPAIELTAFDLETTKRVREINHHVPLSVRHQLTSSSSEKVLEIVRAGVDVVHLVANYHGEGWDSNRAFVKDLLRSVHKTLVSEGVRDEVTLIVSGGITLAEHVPKAIICGADLVALDTTVLVALQARFVEECITPERARILKEEFDTGWGTQRLVNLFASWHDQLIEILSAMGMRDVRRLRGDVGRAMFNEDLEKEAFADIIHGT